MKKTIAAVILALLFVGITAGQIITVVLQAPEGVKPGKLISYTFETDAYHFTVRAVNGRVENVKTDDSCIDAPNGGMTCFSLTGIATAVIRVLPAKCGALNVSIKNEKTGVEDILRTPIDGVPLCMQYLPGVTK